MGMTDAPESAEPIEAPEPPIMVVPVRIVPALVVMPDGTTWGDRLALPVLLTVHVNGAVTIQQQQGLEIVTLLETWLTADSATMRPVELTTEDGVLAIGNGAGCACGSVIKRHVAAIPEPLAGKRPVTHPSTSGFHRRPAYPTAGSQQNFTG